MLKFMYLAKRKPTHTPESFIKRWRQHGELAISMPMWINTLLYIQADPIRPIPIAGASSDYDAVAYTVMRNEDLFRNPSPDAANSVEILLKDESETFAAPIPPVSIMVHEDVLKKGPPGGVTAFLFFDDPKRAESVGKSYAGNAKATRVVVNRKRDDLKMSEEQLLSYEAVVEVATRDVASLQAVLTDDAEAPWRKADLAVITREAILWDKLSEKAA